MQFQGKVYKITNLINGKLYIGQTIKTLDIRFKSHKRGKFAIGLAMRRYSIDNFKIELIDTATSREELNRKEEEWIIKLDTLAPNGYNLQLNGLNRTWSPEHKGKTVSEDSKKKRSENNAKYWLGKTRDEATRQAVSKACTKNGPHKNFSCVGKFGQNHPRYGKPHSIESKNKISIANTGKVGKLNGKSKEVICCTTGEYFESAFQAAAYYKLDPSAITKVCRDKQKQTKGYVFKYGDSLL